MRRVVAGDEIMKKTSASLEDLMGCMEFFFSMMETIGTSSQEQTRSISELDRAVGQIDSSMQQSASVVEELAGTMENLRTLAAVLAGDVQRFRMSE